MGLIFIDPERIRQVLADSIKTSPDVLSQKIVLKKEPLFFFGEEIELEPSQEERACIIASDLDLDFDFAVAVVKTMNTPKPKIIPTIKWEAIKNTYIALYDNDFKLLKECIKNEWSLSDIYGCHPRAPLTRYDAMGLVLLLNNRDKIVKITKDYIFIQQATGSITSFCKARLNKQERVLFYEL